MGTNLYVGNLSFETGEASLRTLFEGGGRTVEKVSIVTDRETGRPRGFAFVEMGSPEDTQAAIQEFDGYELDGRNIKVNEAKPRAPRGGGGGGRRPY